jgi:gliding motility-associated-like protein
MRKLFLTLLFGQSIFQVFGQGFYSKGAIVSLSSQTILTVPDSLVNTGTLVNNGDLRISGAWINLGTYDAGTGEITFNSNQVQTINHNDQSFGKLTIGGTGEKQFLADITIEGELDLQSSVLKSENGAKLILNKDAVVTGGSDQSHVVGPVEAKGTGDWIFPIGNGTTFLPVEIINVTDANAIATLTLNELTSGDVLTGAVELGKLSSKRYWELVLGAGNLNQSKIKLPLADEDGLTDNEDLLIVAGSSTATGPYTSFGQSTRTGNLNSGSVTSEQAPTVSFFTVAALTGERGIEVYNGVSVIQDGQNDLMRIRNIELYPSNIVTVFNRWGDKVFEMSPYDNNQKVFRGESNINGNNKLPTGTYFYLIDLGDGSEKTSGYLVIR